MTIKPISLKNANQYIQEHHRHNIPVAGHKYSLQALNGSECVGVAIVGRPIARMLDDGETVEILRVCTDGTHNACSFLYGACCRVAKAMGYKKIITYTLKSENGASLKASNFTCAGECGGGSWNCKARPRQLEQTTLFGASKKYSTGLKVRWERILK